MGGKIVPKTAAKVVRQAEPGQTLEGVQFQRFVLGGGHSGHVERSVRLGEEVEIDAGQVLFKLVQREEVGWGSDVLGGVLESKSIAGQGNADGHRDSRAVEGYSGGEVGSGEKERLFEVLSFLCRTKRFSGF